MIHHALRSIPARPVLFLAPIIIILVMVVYYYNLYQDCISRGSIRQAFIEAVKKAEQGNRPLILSNITSFAWEHVKGFEGFKPQHKNKSCPLEWDWSEQYRSDLVSKDLLSVFIFFNERKVIHVLEFANDQISLQGIEGTLTPDSARFEVTANGDQSQYIVQIIP